MEWQRLSDAVDYELDVLAREITVAAKMGAPDPRTVGSGRTGGTNALRAMGARRAIAVATLDVRAPAAFAKEHIPGAINIGLSGQFAMWAGSLIPLQASIIIVAESESKLDTSAGSAQSGGCPRPGQSDRRATVESGDAAQGR